MAKRKFISTRPYEEILIRIHPDFVPRLRCARAGKFARGIRSGLSIQPYLSFLFEINEYLPKDHKLTDYQIARCLFEEFPGRQRCADILDAESGRRKKTTGKWGGRSIAYYRREYNRGGLTPNVGGRVGPISFKYNSDGERMSHYSKALLSEDEYNKIMGRYGPEKRGPQPFDWELVKKKVYKKKNKRTRYESFDWCI